MEYTFTLKYLVPRDGPNQEACVELLGAAGCDDALVGIGLPGRIALEFTREAPDARQALTSALSDVKKALPEARLIEAGPDYVGLSDVADMLGMSRQNLHKLMVSHGPAFPPPVHEGSAAIWHLADLLQWLQQRGTYRFDAELIELAQTLRQINLARDAARVSTQALRQWRALLD